MNAQNSPLTSEQEDLLKRFNVHPDLKNVIRYGSVEQLQERYDHMMREVGAASQKYIESSGSYAEDWFTAQRQLVYRRLAELHGVVISSDGSPMHYPV